MSDTSFRRRVFKPAIPAPLLSKLPEGSPERWMYEQQDIQRQQNEAILERLDEGEVRFQQADDDREEIKQSLKNFEGRVVKIERIKERLTAKWSVVVMLVSLVIWPIALVIIGEWCKRFLEKVWK